ncbi:hypothetical protein [Pseudomonas phage D6]|nr:hypothetical protein [Pseudomonas phage D6]
MGMYTGVQIDLRLKKDLPPQIAVWLSKHTMGDGDLADMNAMFTAGPEYFENWKGGGLRYVEGDQQFGDYWHLKVNGCWKHDKNKLAFFLHEIYPWLDMRPREVLARTVYEGYHTAEYIYWVDPDDTLVRHRQAVVYNAEQDVWGEPDTSGLYVDGHPKAWDAEDLAKPLGMESDYPRKAWCDEWTFHFAKNEVVSPNQEEKRILAKQHNENYEKDQLDDIQRQLAELEGK